MRKQKPNIITARVKHNTNIREISRTFGENILFIGLPYNPQMERYYELSAARLDEVKTMYREDGSIVISKEERLFNQRFTTKPPEKSRVFRWRTEMDTETRLRFEAVAGDLLNQLGYPARQS